MKFLRFSLALTALIALPTMALSQSAGVAQISGTVSDSSGALVAGAKITALNMQTGVRRETKTNSQGDFAVPLLPVGVYDISAESSGFEISRKTGLKLNVGDVVRADLTLNVGSTSSTVDVSANAVQLNLENAEVSDVISQRMVADLPLNGRNFTELMVLDGSAYQTFGSPIGQFRPTQGAEIGLSGGRVTSNGYLIDGLNNRDYAFGAPILIPSIDALQEFKLDTKTYSAAYGGTANQINLHFKSGTNQLHGTAYEFLRNNDFDARSFFDPNTIPRLNQNQFGYSLGGPIIIPKLYDGRNKSFFFANYEGTRLKAASSPQFLQVPTDAQWNGQFSTAIIDPLTGSPFPNNQVPAGRISQFAKQEHKFAVTPNTTASGYNFVGSSGTPSTADQQNYKFDQAFGSKNAAFFRYSTSATNTTGGGYNGSGLYNLTTAVVENSAYQGSYTRTFSPTVVNQAQFGHITAKFNTNAPTISKTDLSGFGIQGGFPDQTTPEIPEVIFAGTTTLAGFGVNSNWPFIDSTTYWNGSDDLSVIKGAHTLNMGISVLNWTRTNGRGANLGSWTFNGQYSGDPFADFLLGNPSQIGINVPTPFAATASAAIFQFPQYTIAPYIEDSWKVSPRLTVTLGLRYDFYKQAREIDNRYFWLDTSVPGGAECTASKQAIAAGAGQSGLLKYCGQNPAPSPKKPFAPRIGFAFLPTHSDKTVLRAGYGIFYDGFEEQDEVNAASHYPFLGAQTLTGVPVTNILSTTQPIPSISTIRPAQPSDLGGIYAPNPKKNPYVQQWSFSIGQSITGSTKLDLSYQGAKSTDLPTRYNINQPVYYDPANPLSVAARRPYSNFTGDVFPQITGLNANYNAANIKVEHQSRALVLTAAYTFSKSLDVRSGTFGLGNDINGWAAPMDSHNFRRDYGASSFDITHRAVFSFVHELPIGRGKHFLTNMSKPLDFVIGGWQLNGIAIFQSGFPFSIAANDTGGLIDTYAQRADVVGNPYPSGFHKSINQWFNTAAFAQPTAGVFGNSGRNILRAPGSANWDLSLFKNFAVTERVKFQLRGESFNTFNHANFGIPNDNVGAGAAFGTITSASPGRILQLAGKVIF